MTSLNEVHTKVTGMPAGPILGVMRLGLIAMLALGSVAYLLTLEGGRASAQEGGTGTTATTTATTTNPATGTTTDPISSGVATTTREICAEDPETGEVTCVEEVAPAGEIKALKPLTEEQKVKFNVGPRECFGEPEDDLFYYCEPEIRISGLVSTLEIGEEDEFTVTAILLDTYYDYKLRVYRGVGNKDIGFLNSAGEHDNCSFSQITVTVPSSTTQYYSFSDDFTLHACAARGGTVTAELLQDDSVIESTSKTVTVPSNNVPPTITGGRTSVSFGEGGTGSVETYTASDGNGDSIAWSLPNTSFETDRFDFDISSNGVLTFDNTPNYEDPDDHNDDNVYKITVRASDGEGGTADRNVTITVTNEDPTITSGSSSVTYRECGTNSVGTYRASDPGGGSITWSLPNTSFETDRFDFDISSSGVVSFDDGPDYEDPDDSDDDNVYRITVRASDGEGGTADRNVTITVTNEAPSFTSGLTQVSFAEGGTGSVQTYMASDPCGGSISWSLPNTSFETDRFDFDISSSGVLTFDDTPDYEDPDDSNDDNVYRITVRASDGYGGTADRNVTVTVTNRNPTFTSGSSSVTYRECGTNSVGTYRASDPGGGSITWSLPNTSFETDRFDFDISSSGVVTFDDGPDFEDPDDSNDDNVYRITVRASDGEGGTADRNVTITITNEAPSFTSGLTQVNFAEGGTGSVQTYMASDPCGGSISWSLPNTSFETDRFDFDISSSGVLTFDDTPDYEDPDDHNDDNVYRITVRASDGYGGTADRNVTVTVTNRNPTFTSGSSSVTYRECGTHPVGTYRASDPGGGSIAWSLPNTSFETERADFDISSSGVVSFDEDPDYEDPDDSDDDNVYRITVRASDGEGGTADRNVTITVTNEAPSFTSGLTQVSFAEGGTGSVQTYMASDPCGGSISWSLPNTSFETDRFDFDISSSGVLTFDDTPDYEDPDDSNDDNVYRITVRASDGYGGTADRNVTVTVTNVNEAPVSTAIDDRTLAHNVTSLEIDLSNYFSDPDTSDTLSYSASSLDTSIATVSVSGNDLTITRNGSGTTIVTVTAADRSPGHADRLTATQDFSVTVEAQVPKVTIARQNASVTEGQDVKFTLTASSAPAAALMVKVSVADSGTFLTGTAPTDVTIASGSATAQLTLRTTDDTVDEANGTTTATVLPGTGYTVGSPAAAATAVEDNDLPPAPTGLRANGHLVDGKITLRWNAVPGATGYNVRYAEEVCVSAPRPRQREDATCGLGNPPMWNTITAENITIQGLTISGVTVIETSLQFTPPEPLRSAPLYNTLNIIPLDLSVAPVPWPLYHVEVQAVIVDSSDWSDFALVFPTTEPPEDFVTRVASNWFRREYQPERNGSHEYGYTMCKGTITTDVAWSWSTNELGDLVRDTTTVATIAADVEAAIERWETTVRWVTNSANIISATATEKETCTDSDSNPVKFIPDDMVKQECGYEDSLACAPLGTSEIFLRSTPLRGTSSPGEYELTSWDVMAGGCSLLHIVVLHEAGHVFGLSHSHIPQSLMYPTLAGQSEPFCKPPVYDVVGMMANYQSR